MGYLIEIDSLSCHVTYAKPESIPAGRQQDDISGLEQIELELECFSGGATEVSKETEE